MKKDPYMCVLCIFILFCLILYVCVYNNKNQLVIVQLSQWEHKIKTETVHMMVP